MSVLKLKYVCIIFLLFSFHEEGKGLTSFNEIVLSPDGKSSAQYKDGKIEASFNGVKHLYDSFSLVSPLKWSSNSRNIIVISHIAHGATACVIQLDKVDGFPISLDPMVDNVKGYYPLKIDVDGEIVRCHYKVAVWRNYENADNYIYKYNFNLNTKKIEEIKIKKISLQEYLLL